MGNEWTEITIKRKKEGETDCDALNREYHTQWIDFEKGIQKDATQ